MSQSPPPSNSPSNYLSRLLRLARKPCNVAIGLVSVSTIIIGYTGLRLFLQENLPPWLEKQVSYLINRPVDIDELQGFSLTRLYLGATSIPQTSEHPNQLTASRIIVHFDIIAILFKRTLAIKIVPENVEIKLHQYSEGDLLKGEITDEIIPLKLDLTFDVTNASVDIFPKETDNLLATTVNGRARYSEVTTAEWDYNLRLSLLSSEISLEGKTVIETKESQVQLVISKLDFSQLMPLVVNFPVQLNQGDIKANLNLNFLSITRLSETKAEGIVDLDNIQGQIKSFKKPLRMAANILFQENKILIKNFQASLGNVTASLSGQYDWSIGFDLEANINGLNARNIQQVYPIKLPIEMEGELTAKLKIIGKLNNPLLKGKIENRKLLKIAKTEFKKITIDFNTDLDNFFLENLSIIPKVGGNITARGVAQPKIIQSIIYGKSISWNSIPFELVFKTELPSHKLVDGYYQLPIAVNLNSLKIQGNIQGSFINLKGLIKWNIDGNLNKINTDIIGRGNFFIEKNNIILKNVELVTKRGKVIINGSGNIKNKKWQAYLHSNFLDLTPFTSAIHIIKNIKHPDNIYLKNARITVGGDFNKPWKKSLNLSFYLALSLDGSNLFINSQLQKSKFTASGTGLQLTSNLLLNDVSIPITFKKYQFNVSGNIEEILQKSAINIDAVKGNSNLEIEIAKSSLNAQITWQNGSFKGIARLRSLSLNQFISQLSIPIRVTNSEIDFAGDLRSLISLSNTSDFNDFQVNANTQFEITDGSITTISQLNQGKITFNATATPIKLTGILPQITIPIEVKKTNIDLIAYLPDLLNFDLKRVQGNIQLKLGVATEEITTSTKLINNQWKTNIIANRLGSSIWNSQLFRSKKIEPIDAKINLSGTLKSLLSPDSIIPVQVNNISVKAGQQNIEADGSITLDNLLSNPDIAYVDMNVQAQADLSIFPITNFLHKIPINKQFLPQSINLAGRGKFEGRLIIKNLLTSPILKDNLKLKGTLNLLNLAFNTLNFESTLNGEIDLVSGKKISLNLRGKQDIITATFTSCTQQKCLLSYIPEYFNIIQRYKNSSPISFQGNRKNNRLVANVKNFPLKQLKLLPMSNYGLTDHLGGNVNLDLEINPFNLKGRGKVDIYNINLGEVFGDNLQINWVYQKDRISLTKTSIKLGQSNYDIEGSIVLNTGEIKANLHVSKGYIQELLTILKIYNFDSLLQFLQINENSSTHFRKKISQSVGNINAPLSKQVNQLWENDQEIKKIAVERRAGRSLQELDIKGQFSGKITLSGTLETPEMDFQFEGESWEWASRLPTPSIVNPLGFILEGSPIISIDKLAIKGKLGNKIANINSIIKLKESSAQANLNLTYDNNQFYLQPSTFSLNNLTLDTVRDLIVIPGDINGSIDMKGNLAGSLIKPEINGIFSFKKGVVNARLLEHNFQGNFIYRNAQLELQIDKPGFIQAYARFPLPLEINDNNQFKINVQLETEAFSLLEIITEERVSWVKGEGQINLNLNGQITIDNELKVSFDDSSESVLDFKSMTFNSHLLPDTLTLNGNLSLQNKKIKVNKLTGEMGAITINMIGVLPLFPSFLNDVDSTIPLNITLTQEKAKPNSLYQGIANASILIKGAILNPIIEGEIQLNHGKVVVPNSVFDIYRNSELSILRDWIRRVGFLEEIVILPKFNDFRILIQEVVVEQKKVSPQFNFNIAGNLSLSGQLASLSLPGLLALKPSGKVYINSGKVDIPVTRVFTSRRPNNVITFLPQKGLLNPHIDLEFKLYILNIALRTINTNEVPNDIVQSGRSQSVEITLGIKGDANQLVPNLGTKLEKVCQLRPDNYLPIPKNSEIDPGKFRQLIKCIQVNNFGTNSIGDLLQSPIVSFSSSPRLSNSELLTLFRKPLPNLIEQLQQQNSAQLVEAGLPQVAVVLFPFLQDWLFEFNETTNRVGTEWGIGNLRLYPVLEKVYELEDNSLIRFSYDYSFNEVIIRYENKF